MFDDTTPLVEGLSIDEAFLDVRGLERLSGTPTEIAVQLRREVRERVGLPITVGIARTKFLAKVASGVAKPDGLLAVPPDGELAFLHPLPVERLWGVGHVTARRLHDVGITTVGEVARLSEACWSHCSAERRDGTCTRLPTTATRGRCRRAGAGARSARSGRSGVRRRRSPRSTPRSWRSSNASRAGCGPPTGSAEPSSFDCASTTSRGRRARTRCRTRRRTPRRFSRRREGCSQSPCR